MSGGIGKNKAQQLAEEAGVEPTESRLATLSGFEVRPPHRERFSSVALRGHLGLRARKQVSLVRVDAANVAAPHG
jgi:hypothetical protein